MADLTFDLRLVRDGAEFAMAGEVPLDGVTALVGPSGSGKSTLLHMLAGLEPRAQGLVRFGEEVWTDGRRHLPPEARRVGMVFQEANLFDHMTVTENILYGARRRGIAPAVVRDITAAMGLEAMGDRRPTTLSGGEMRRVALARALASGPQILFLDEPLAALDDAAKDQLMPYLGRIVSGLGLPVLYVTHSQAEVTQLADRELRVGARRIQGWGQPPVTLDVTVAATRGGHLTLELGRVQFVLPGQGQPGDARRIALPEAAVLLSRNAPGPSGALAVLKAEVLSVVPRPSGAEVTLQVEGQRLGWHIAGGTDLAEPLPSKGERLWLALLDAHLR